MAHTIADGRANSKTNDGKCHLGPVVKTAPPAGVILQGQSPALGLRALRIAGVNRPCPIDFLLLNCHPVAAARAIVAQVA